MKMVFLSFLLFASSSVYSSEAHYQALLATYNELVTLNSSLQAMTPPKGDLGDKGLAGVSGLKGDTGGVDGGLLSAADVLTIDTTIEEIFTNLEIGRVRVNTLKSASDTFLSRTNATVDMVNKLDADAALIESRGL